MIAKIIPIIKRIIACIFLLLEAVGVEDEVGVVAEVEASFLLISNSFPL
jgi:hypothetical protein